MKWILAALAVAAVIYIAMRRANAATFPAAPPGPAIDLAPKSNAALMQSPIQFSAPSGSGGFVGINTTGQNYYRATPPPPPPPPPTPQVNPWRAVATSPAPAPTAFNTSVNTGYAVTPTSYTIASPFTPVRTGFSVPIL